MTARRFSRLLVVKLGGSLASEPELRDWIGALEACPLPLVVVPGGGAFADAVRSVQQRLGFDDRTAHHMALLAMEQYGIALRALWPGLAIAATLTEIRCLLQKRQPACWNPVAMALAAPLPQSWELTSDSLAAWLAGLLAAPELLLIKSIDAGSGDKNLHDLVAAGLVDPLFPDYAAASGAAVHVAGPASLATAAVSLMQGDTPGRKIRLA